MSWAVESRPPLPRRFQYGPSAAHGWSYGRPCGRSWASYSTATSARVPVRQHVAGLRHPGGREELLRQVVLVPQTGGLLDDRGQQAVADVRVVVASARPGPQLGRQRPGDHGPPRQGLVVVAERLHEARGVGEQVPNGDPALVRRHAVEEAVDRVGHPQPPLRLQLDDGGRGELLGHRTDVVDGLAAGCGTGLVIGFTPAPAGRQLAVDRRHQAPARPVGCVGRVERLRLLLGLLLGRRLLRLARREQKGNGDGRGPPSQSRTHRQLTVSGSRCSVHVQPSRTRASTWASVSAHSPTHVNRSSSTRPLWAAADQVRKVRATAVAAPTATTARRVRQRLARSATPPRSSPNASRVVAVGLGEVERQVPEVLAVAVPHCTRVGEQAELQEPAPHASPGVGRIATRAPRAAAAERSRSTSADSSACPAAVSR